MKKIAYPLKHAEGQKTVKAVPVFHLLQSDLQNK
jgi:hypothetical protein